MIVKIFTISLCISALILSIIGKDLLAATGWFDASWFAFWLMQVEEKHVQI